MGAVLQFASG